MYQYWESIHPVFGAVHCRISPIGTQRGKVANGSDFFQDTWKCNLRACISVAPGAERNSNLLLQYVQGGVEPYNGNGSVRKCIMIQSLHTLPKELQSILMVAAILRSSFDLDTLLKTFLSDSNIIISRRISRTGRDRGLA
jgi:hypothetical protein